MRTEGEGDARRGGKVEEDRERKTADEEDDWMQGQDRIHCHCPAHHHHHPAIAPPLSAAPPLLPRHRPTLATTTANRHRPPSNPASCHPPCRSSSPLLTTPRAHDSAVQVPSHADDAACASSSFSPPPGFLRSLCASFFPSYPPPLDINDQGD